MNIMSCFVEIILFENNDNNVKKINYNNLTPLIIVIIVDYFGKNGDDYEKQKIQKQNKRYNENKKYEYKFHFNNRLMKQLSQIN